MYVIDVASMDFPDGAQRFNWCNCHTPDALAAGLGDLTDAQAASMPIVDWSISDLNLLPAPPATTSVASVFSSASSSPLVEIAVVALLAWFFIFRKRGRR